MAPVNMKGRDPLPPLWMKEKRRRDVADIAVALVCAGVIGGLCVYFFISAIAAMPNPFN